MLNDRCSTSTFSALAFDRVLAAQLPPGASLAAARFDFALLALLRGNDYLPRMRGVKCETRFSRPESLFFEYLTSRFAAVTTPFGRSTAQCVAARSRQV